MMEINLLPQVPKTKKYLWPIAIISAIVLISFSSIIGVDIWKKSNLLEEKKQVLEQLHEQRKEKQGSLAKDQENAQLINLYNENYKLLMATHVNIVPYIDELSTLLPQEGIITSVNWSDVGMMKVTGEFDALDMIGQYVQLLEQRDWVKGVNVTNINQAGSDSHISSATQNSDIQQFEMEIEVDQQVFYQKGVDRHD